MRLTTILPTLAAALMSCAGEKSEGTPDWCGRLAQAVCNCDTDDGASCDEAETRNDAAQQLNDNGDTEGYENAQSTCQVDYEALDDECTGEDGGDASDGTDGGTAGGCPDEVPEQFRNTWDCSAEACGAPVLYRYATGSSNADDEIVVSESYFVFSGPGEWCVDTFEVSGEISPVDPATFNCSECEELWESTWEMTTGNACGLAWGGLFEQGSSEAEGPFYGYLMFDTHSPLAGRNPDNAMLVFSATSDSASGGLQFNNNWADGTATPTTSADTWPHDYEYVSAPLCTARSTTAGPGPQLEPVAVPESVIAAP